MGYILNMVVSWGGGCLIPKASHKGVVTMLLEMFIFCIYELEGERINVSRVEIPNN